MCINLHGNKLQNILYLFMTERKRDCYNEVRRVPLTWTFYGQKSAVSVVRVVGDPIAVGDPITHDTIL